MVQQAAGEMLGTLDRYVLRQLAGPFLWSVALLTFVLIVDRIYQLTDLVVTKGVPFSLALGLLGFVLPTLLIHTLPMALLIALLLVTGRLGTDLEVVALYAAGVSPLRLCRPFLLAACLVSLSAALLTLWVTPWANDALERRLVKILQTHAGTKIQERAFNRSPGQMVLYVDEASPSHLAFRGVLVSDERDPQLSRIITARQGRLLTDVTTDRTTLRLLNGAIQEFDLTRPLQYRSTSFALYDMPLIIQAPPREALGVVKLEETLSLPQLLSAAADLRSRGHDVVSYDVEFYKRFVFPLGGLIFSLVGFSLGIRTQRGGRAGALAGGLGIAVAYYMLLVSLEAAALAHQIPPWAAIWASPFLFSTVGLILLRATLKSRLPMALASGPRQFRTVRLTRASSSGSARLTRPPTSTWLIDRYLIRQYLIYLGTGLAIGAVLFTIVDILQTMDHYLSRRPPLLVILEYVLLQLPLGLYQQLPLVVLVATTFLFLSLARHHELTALKAAGVSMYRVSRPVLLLALSVSVASLVFQETLLPRVTAKAEEVYRTKIRGQWSADPPSELEPGTQIWHRSANTRFIRISTLDAAKGLMEGITLLEIDRDFQILNRLDARQARWTPSGWEFQEGVFREIKEGNWIEAIPFRVVTLELPEIIEDFSRPSRPTDMMNFLELRAHIKQLQRSGYQVRDLLVKLYEKLSFPPLHAISALLAIPFALLFPRGEQLIGIGLAIALTMGYWVVDSLASSFAKADLLPPLLAAWTANIVFTGLGLFFFLRART